MKTLRKVAIVGRAPTASLAPFHDPDWEIWGMGWVTYPREDRTFDPHQAGTMTSDIIETGKNKPIPVWGYPNGDYPNCVPYPFDIIRKEITPFLESSIAYMIALAIYENVDEIGIYGVHMELYGEYFEQMPNLMYLIGLAEGKGIKVTTAPGCPLFLSMYECGYYGGDGKRRFPELKVV